MSKQEQYIVLGDSVNACDPNSGNSEFRAALAKFGGYQRYYEVYTDFDEARRRADALLTQGHSWTVVRVGRDYEHMGAILYKGGSGGPHNA